jgi:hypothetical protein
MAFDISSFFKNYGSALPGIGQAAGGAMSLFGNNKNPADIANKYISQIPGQTQQYYQPYMEAGKGAMSDLQNQYKNLLSGDVQNKLGENYKQSPGYQFALEQALAGANNAAATGGMLGIPAHQQQNMQIAEGLASQDYNNYLQNQMGLYGQGLQGNQQLNQMGYNANTDYATNIANALAQQGAYAFEGQQGLNQKRSQGLSDIFGGLGGAAASFTPGGSALMQLLKLFGGNA